MGGPAHAGAAGPHGAGRALRNRGPPRRDLQPVRDGRRLRMDLSRAMDSGLEGIELFLLPEGVIGGRVIAVESGELIRGARILVRSMKRLETENTTKKSCSRSAVSTRPLTSSKWTTTTTYLSRSIH